VASKAQHTGVVRTILFVDVYGNTKLYESLGNRRAEAVIAKALELSSQAAAHLGTVIKNGDEIICTFVAASDAASAAVDMQRSLQQAVWSAEIAVKTLKTRTGFHARRCVWRCRQRRGPRHRPCQTRAKPGQILFTKETLDKLPPDGVGRVRYVGSTPPKGKKQPLELFEVLWKRDDLTQVEIPTQTRRGDIRLTARFKQATLELIDHSLNGTYLCRRGRAEVVLRREEIALEGSGLIGLGKTTGEAPLCVSCTVHRGRRSANATSRRRAAPEP
jgi:class 3 adenylate cyclase